MFKAATNPYDELVVKATSEDLVSEDWDTNLQICDKVQDDGENGAKNVIAALVRRLSHRNPNVQMFALELANSLAQNCGRPAHSELSSRAWTGALERLISDRTTLQPVRTKALHFVKEWNNEFGGDSSIGVMGELYESLRAKKYSFDDGPAADPKEDEATRRARQEDEELQRVLELSKQDKGGRNTAGASSSSKATGGSSSSNAPSGSSTSYPVLGGAISSTPVPSYASQQNQPPIQNSVPLAKPYEARDPTPPPMPTRATASRVRAIYPFVTQEKAELSFQKGDVIKVIDRMYDEWYTGAVGGRIGIFPISYVEPLPDPTPAELAKEAQEEARVFAAQGMIVTLQRMLDGLDPTRGDRVDNPELEDMYQKTVALQPQIMGLMKKYSDQKAELEHIHRGFVKASRQYVQMTQPQPQQPVMQPPGYPYDPSAQARPGLAHQNSAQSFTPATGYPAAPAQAGQDPAMDPAQQRAAEEHALAWKRYYEQMAALQAQSGQVGGDPNAAAHYDQGSQQQPTEPATEGARTGDPAEEERARAWAAYYAAQNNAAPTTAPQAEGSPLELQNPYSPTAGGEAQAGQQAFAAAYYPEQQQAAQGQAYGARQYAHPNGGSGGVDGLTQGMQNVSMHRG